MNSKPVVWTTQRSRPSANGLTSAEQRPSRRGIAGLNNISKYPNSREMCNNWISIIFWFSFRII